MRRSECWRASSRDRQVVERDGHRLPVEIAAGDEIARDGEDHGVVRRRVDLDRQDLPHEAERVARRAVDLGHASKRVSVLHAAAVGVSALDRAVRQDPPEVGGARLLAALRASVVDPLRRTRGAIPATPSSVIAPTTVRGDREPLGAQERKRPMAVMTWVPLISAMPSLAARTTGVDARALHRGARGHRLPR
jgi:hypothetical protein